MTAAAAAAGHHDKEDIWDTVLVLDTDDQCTSSVQVGVVRTNFHHHANIAAPPTLAISLLPSGRTRAPPPTP